MICYSGRQSRDSIWLLIITLCLLCVGCGEASTSAERPIHLVVAIQTDARGCEIYEELFDAYEQHHPDVHLERIYIYSGNYYQKVLTMIAGNVAPDVMWMGEGFNEFAQRDAFLDLTDRIRQIDTSEFHQAALNWYRVDGRQYGVPYGIDMRFVVFNKRLFDQADVPYPENGWVFDDFLDKALRLTVRQGKNVSQWGFWGNLDAASFGACFISTDGLHALCESAETLRFLSTNLELLKKYRVTPSLRDVPPAGVQDSISLFQQGTVAMMPMYTWDLPGMRERCAMLDWDIVENPWVTQRGSWASSQAYVISSQTRHPDAAWELVRMLTGPWFQRQISYAMLPTNLRVAQEVIAENESKPRNLVALLKASDALFPNPRIANLQELDSFYQDALQSVWSERAAPEQAMALAAEQIGRAIARHRRAAK